MMDIMEGIKEKQELSNEFNHPVKIEIKDQELGFQSLDFSDQTLDHDSLGDQNDGVTKKLNEMTIEGLSGEEEGSEMVVALETEGGFDKGGNFMVQIGGESDQGGLGGFRDGGGDDEGEIEEKKPEKLSVVEGNEGDKVGSELCENENLVDDRNLEGFINDEVRIEESGSGKFGVVEGNEGDFEGVKEGGGENENRVGDRDLEVFINDEVKIEERKSGKLCVEEGNEGDFKVMKEGGKDEEGDKWSEIENEVGDLDLEGVKDEAKIEERNPEKRSVVEENEGDYKEMKDGGNNKEGSKWGKIEDVEENNNLDVNDENDGKGKEVILDYEDGWGGNWDDVAVRPEYNLEQQYFDRNGEAQYDEEPHRYGNAEKDSVGLNDGNFGSDHYPLRPAAEDCSFYMRTGTCKFGSNCKFNHPLERKNQAARDIFKQKEEIYDKPKQAECKYYLSSGGCKYGKACRYNHGRGKAAVTPNLELNFLGLPIRVGEKECPFFMRTGSCKYGSNCRFHHPDPTVAGGDDTTSPGRGSTSPRTLIKTAPFGPVIYPPTPSAPPNAEWNGYQAPAYRTSQRNLPVPPALSMNILATDSSFYAQPGSHLVVDEFPERPGQPECSFYLKTGDCKYRSSCKFHHPKNPKTSVTLSNEGLPLRPGQSICSHFSRYGICKFGPSCKYDHSVGDNAASSNGSDQGRPIQFNCFADEYGEWETEPMRSV